MKILILIIAYRTPKKELLRLKRELSQTDLNYRLVTADNTRHNIGLAARVNRVIRAQQTVPQLIMLLNPDVHLQKLTARDIERAAKRFDVFGGCFEQGGTWYYGGNIDPIRMSGGLSTRKPHGTYSSCDFVSGSLMIIGKHAINTIGLLNEQFFLYYEDVEYARRAQRAGFRVGISTNLQYSHQEQSKYYDKKEYYLTRNRLLFLNQYGTARNRLREAIYFLLWLPTLLYNRNSKNRYKLKGYLDFIKNPRLRL